MSEQKDPFYIGYLPGMPQSLAHHVRRIVAVFLLAVFIAGAIIALRQHKFSDAVFEFGNLTEVEGVLKMKPVPRLIMNEHGVSKAVLLVGFGKCGAEETIEAMENVKGQLLDGREVTLRGTLIYDDMHTMMELTGGTEALVELGGISHLTTEPDFVRTANFTGEVIDPKCCLGVMKPGEGKTHRACGVRCISGGITPMLKTVDQDGLAYYFILTSNDGKPLNHRIVPFVADQVTVPADLYTLEDWHVLMIDPAQLTRI